MLIHAPGAWRRTKEKTMKHLKKLGLAVLLGAASLTTFAGSAFADGFTYNGNLYTGEIVATSNNARFIGSFVTVECKNSEFKTNVEKHSEDYRDVGGIFTVLTFTNCNYTVTVQSKGSMDVDAAGAGSGGVDFFGTQIWVQTSVGTCVFTAGSTFGTAMGNFTGNYWGKATFDIEGKLPRTAGNFLCGSSGILGGTYSVTTPANLAVHGI
jgi:hypothetical protein